MLVPLDELSPRTRPRWLRISLTLIPAIAFMILLWFGLMRSTTKATIGNAAPDFELPSVTTGEIISSEDLKGRPVVINFWASWCIPCREEAPLLERAYREYRDDGVIFLGVNIKDADSAARAFIEEFDITYPNVRDVNQELTRPFGVLGLPETFFLDHNWTFFGTVRGDQTSQQEGTVVRGAISEEELVTKVELLIQRSCEKKISHCASPGYVAPAQLLT